MEQEIWKDVVGREGKYKVSSHGNVLKFSNGEWVPQRLSKHTRGYLQFAGILVHVAVCEAFHGERPTSKHTPDHIDKNKKNNHYSNLKWATMKEQLQGREKFTTRKRPVLQKTKDGQLVAKYPTLTAAAKAMGRDYPGSVHNACRGILKSYLGYIWEYAD
jgi:hypothetical protein